LARLRILREGSTKLNRDAGLERNKMERRIIEIDDLKYFSI
jgi:hypothetical protein